MRYSRPSPLRLLIPPLLTVVTTASPAPATPLDTAAPVDVCKMVSLDDVRPLVTHNKVELRAIAGKPRAGRGGCAWGAYDPGLIASAPAQSALTVEVYRSGDPSWTAKQFAEDFKRSLVPSEVRTGDRSDLMARPKPDTVAALHGASVVVVNAKDQQYAIQRSPDRIYRLEAFALKMAGAVTRGPVDPRSTQDACTPLDPQHALGVLTREPSSLKISRDGTRCTMDVEDGSGVNGHWTENRGEVQIERQDVATNAEALRFQHDQTPFLPISTLVRTSDPSDRLVTSSDHPEDVWAVHGANYVSLEVENETPAARTAPGWPYRVQRLAFEAAGATIVPTPGTPPDPVVPGPVASESSDPTGKRWTPPAHDAPATSWLVDPIVTTIAFLAAYRFFLMPVWIVLSMAMIGIAAKRRTRAGSAGRRSITWPALFIPLGVLNIMFGTSLATTLVYHDGVSGSAIVTSSRPTSARYNNRIVRAHAVLIRKPDGGVVETGFESDDFNVYPSHNETIYPGENDAFTVRYLKSAPRTFVIVADDDSPWARGLRCETVEQTLSDAQEKSRFAPDNPGYKAAYLRASAAAHANGCDAAATEE